VASNANSDPHVVSSQELRELIYLEFQDAGEDEWINEVARILDVDRRNVYRKFYIQDYVTWGVADDWLTKLDMPGQVHHLRAMPNPRWTQEHWINYMAERGCI
jgi:hypothetical protein